MGEHQVDWNALDGQYIEDPPYGAGFSTDPTNRRNISIIPPDALGNNSQSHETYPLDSINSNSIKPDAHKNLTTKENYTRF